MNTWRENINSQLTNLEGRVTNMETQQSTVNATVDSLTEKVDSLTSKTADLEGRVTSLEEGGTPSIKVHYTDRAKPPTEHNPATLKQYINNHLYPKGQAPAKADEILHLGTQPKINSFSGCGSTTRRGMDSP